MTRQARVPEVAIIAAMTQDRVIGLGDGLPWDLPEDRQLFKNLTTGSTVIMGRRTYQSINHPLADRLNIVLSRTLTDLPGVTVCKSLIEGLEVAGRFGRPVFIIGGAGLYREALPVASVLHISWVGKPFDGNVHFPEFDLADWTLVEQKGYPGFHYERYLRQKN
ncbi:MAG: dihydrofolate reductase [Desulfuromonadales bacterium]